MINITDMNKMRVFVIHFISITCKLNGRKVMMLILRTSEKIKI